MKEPTEPIIRVRDRRSPNQFTVHNRLIDEWYPIITQYGLALYSLYCRMASKGDEHCYPGLRLIAAHMQMSVSTASEYNKLLTWCELIYVHAGAAGANKSNDYYLLEVPTVTPERLAAIRTAAETDLALLRAEREREAQKLEAGGLPQEAAKLRKGGKFTFHKMVFRQLSRWKPIQSYWNGREKPAPIITQPGQLTLFDGKSYPQLGISDPLAEHPDPLAEQGVRLQDQGDPLAEHPDPLAEQGVRLQDQNNPNTTILNNNPNQQSTTTTNDAVADILAWMGFVGILEPAEALTLQRHELLAWAYHVRADPSIRRGKNPVGIARNNWRAGNPPPPHWLDLARVWLDLDNSDRRLMLQLGDHALHTGAAYALNDLDHILEKLEIDDSTATTFCRLYADLDGDVAPAALMPPDEEE